MTTHAMKIAMGLAVAFGIGGCGEAPETDRARIGADAMEDALSVSLGLADGAGDLALVSNAFSGYVLALNGGAACWGPQGGTFDSASNQKLVVRKGAAGCGVNILRLRFKEGASEVVATSEVAQGLEAAAGRKGNFIVGDTRVLEVKAANGITTTSDSLVMLTGRELRVDATARHVIKSCRTPWGVEIADGDKIKGFSAQTVPYGSQCPSKDLLCSDGNLSDAATFKFASCSAPTLVSVTLSSDKAEVLLGSTGQFTVKASFSDGTSQFVTPQSFQAVPANLTQITAAGAWKGVADGAFSVTAKFDGIQSNALGLSVYKLVNENVTVADGTAVQKLGLTQKFSGGTSLAPDQTTAAAACMQMGYLSGSIISTHHFVAPYNETLWAWTGASWTFRKTSGGDRDHIVSMNCVRQCKVVGASKSCTPN